MDEHVRPLLVYRCFFCCRRRAVTATVRLALCTSINNAAMTAASLTVRGTLLACVDFRIHSSGGGVRLFPV